MSKTSFIDPVASISGSLTRSGDVHFRTRNGKTHTYCIVHPHEGPATEAQSATRKSFGERIREAGSILQDPALRAEWETRYAVYLKDVQRHPANYPRPCSTLRGFIISTLSKA